MCWSEEYWDDVKDELEQAAAEAERADVTEAGEQPGSPSGSGSTSKGGPGGASVAGPSRPARASSRPGAGPSKEARPKD